MKVTGLLFMDHPQCWAQFHSGQHLQNSRRSQCRTPLASICCGFVRQRVVQQAVRQIHG